MAIPSRTIRGLQDIHTHSGRVSEAAIPYKAYMRLSCLEMEKFRRTQEKASAMTRVRNIEARFREIDEEKAAILNAMEDGKGIVSPPEQTPDTKPVQASRQGTGAFKVKY
jgi:hypothetical protein